MTKKYIVMEDYFIGTLKEALEYEGQNLGDALDDYPKQVKTRFLYAIELAKEPFEIEASWEEPHKRKLLHFTINGIKFTPDGEIDEVLERDLT